MLIVFLKFGGYLVINLIEVLVFIDVNLGCVMCECNIEVMVLKINLEVVIEVVC